jgi:hypothetical protein
MASSVKIFHQSFTGVLYGLPGKGIMMVDLPAIESTTLDAIDATYAK